MLQEHSVSYDDSTDTSDAKICVNVYSTEREKSVPSDDAENLIKKLSILTYTSFPCENEPPTLVKELVSVK
jgi:hypothetical protein